MVEIPSDGEEDTWVVQPDVPPSRERVMILASLGAAGPDLPADRGQPTSWCGPIQMSQGRLGSCFVMGGRMSSGSCSVGVGC